PATEIGSPFTITITAQNASGKATQTFYINVRNVGVAGHPFQPVTISGQKFNDLNGNGTKDTGEPGLAGWTINLTNSSGTVAGSTVTDAKGNYSFADVAGGLAGLSVTRSVNIDGITQTPGYEGDPAIAVDPANPKLLFAAANRVTVGPVAVVGLFGAYSTDG